MQEGDNGELFTSIRDGCVFWAPVLLASLAEACSEQQVVDAIWVAAMAQISPTCGK